MKLKTGSWKNCGEWAKRWGAPYPKILMLLLVAFSTFFGPTAHSSNETLPENLRRVELHWEPEDTVKEYELELSAKPDFEKKIFSKRLNDVRYLVDLPPGNYYYRVRAIDEHGIPGRWTSVQTLSVNPRPPKLIAPTDGTRFAGGLPDSGIELSWKTSGREVKYLLDVKTQDLTGDFNVVVMRQEIDDLNYAFFPQEIGKYLWSVSTLGAAGEEPGTAWQFYIEGVPPRGKGPDAKRVVVYISPWWRKHWTLWTRYGQAQLGYNLIDRDLGATSSFSGLTGFLSATLYWEWHNPVAWTFGGIPWVEFEYEIDRQTVLTESVVLPRLTFRVGSWYDEWIKGWRFSPTLEFGAKQLAIYQFNRVDQAARANTSRMHLGFGPAAQYQFLPYLTFGASAKVLVESGGQGGFPAKAGTGDQFDLSQRASDLNSATAIEGILSATLTLNPRMSVQARLRYESASEGWVPTSPILVGVDVPPGTGSSLSSSNVSFDLGFGYKF